MKKIIYALAVLAFVGTACTKEIHENGITPQEQNNLSVKLVGENEGKILPGSVLVKLDAEATAKIIGGGYAEISGDLLGDIEIKSFSPAIPAKPKNMEVARKYGLDRWFTVSFSEDVKPQTVADRLAKSSMVRSVQYSREIKPVWSDNVQVYEARPMTKADDRMLFNDPYSVHQWNLHNDGTIAEKAVAGADIGVKDAWRLTGGDPSVVVAVFDCGLHYTHPDLKANMWVNEAELTADDGGTGKAGVDDDGNGFIDDKYGFNFVGCTAINADYVNGKIDGKKQEAVKGKILDATKGYGHGTHVAGIIAATNGNGKGVSSIAGGTGNGDGVRVMSCQIFDGITVGGNNPTFPGTSDAQTAAAFIYAADNGACIAQCSWGNRNVMTSDDIFINGDEERKIDGAPLEYAAIKYFLDPANSNHESLQGNIAVFCSGNFSEPYSMYPGALSEVLSVTAIGYDMLPAGYTNYGPGCTVAAPGGEMIQESGHKQSMILSLGVNSAQYINAYPGVDKNGGESKEYVYMLGTSMACPHVSGVLALGISYAKKLGKTFSRQEMVSKLLTSVNDIDQYLGSGTKSFYDSAVGAMVNNIPLNRFQNKMGTGAVDAWKFLMAIEGTPSVIVEAGAKSAIDLTDYCNPHDTYEISIDEAAKESLGLTSDPVIKNGKLEIECSKVGAGKITLSASVGKDTEIKDGIGGISYSREISIVSRQFATNNGGWL